MTIAVTVKVNDGIVLASDSAVTMQWTDPRTGQDSVVNVFNSGRKIFRLHDPEVALGAITWGSASIGGYSLKILAKEFRAQLREGSTSLRIDPDNYYVEEVAERFKAFMFDGYYQRTYSALPTKPSMGFMVAGFSRDQLFGEVWGILLQDGECNGPFMMLSPGQVGFRYEGMPECLSRLLGGFDEPKLVRILQGSGLPEATIEEIVDQCYNQLGAPILVNHMPIEDAIDLATFMAETTARFTRFCLGPDSVGGPIEVATLTKYEGFKWVRRKHFFDRTLNP
ncbi:MAG: hypothetical protein AB1646_12805 [Thermodesulfobacteriota bacterium]